MPPMKRVTSWSITSASSSGPSPPSNASRPSTMSGGSRRAAARRVGDEAAEIVVDLAPRRHALGADPGLPGLPLHVAIDQRDEGDAVSRWHVDQPRRDRRGHRRRIVVPHVEAIPFGQSIELRGSERAHVVLEPGNRTWPERIDHRLPQARVVRRVEHREAAYRAVQLGVGRAVVVPQEPIAMEHGAFDDREALAIRQARATRRRSAATPMRRTRPCGRRGDARGVRGRSGTGRP